MTHDYKRNGTIDLFAAMNVATGEVHDRPPEESRRRRRVAVLQADRRQRPPRAGDPRRPGQPVRPLRTGDHEVAGAPRPAPLAPAFHPTSSSLAEPDRALVQGTDRQATTPRHLHQRRSTSPTRSPPGPNTGTRTPNRSSGRPPPKTSSPKSDAAAPPSTRSNRRRTTRSSKAIGMAIRPSSWSSTRRRRRVLGTNPRRTRRPPNFVKPPQTATR